MRPTDLSGAVQPAIRRELIKLLYTSLPQVIAITVTSGSGAIALALDSGDIGYALISCLILITAAGRLYSLRRYRLSFANFSDQDVLRWERIYGIGAVAFSVGLGLLSFRALRLGDAAGAWMSFGLSMSFCVGMVSRAAVRPWIVLSASAVLFAPTIVAGLLRPELAYKLGACMLFLFWVMLREASRHLSTAFIERLEAQQALARQAHHDFLTGLPNRAAFLSALENAAGRVAIIAIDLDGFKSVNDRLGHHAGDSLLRQVAERLTHCIGPQGAVARFGGDEFMLLRPVDSGPAGKDAAVALTKRVVEALSLPFFVSQQPVRIGASAGILVTELTADAAVGTASLLEQVDRALYAAKRAGGGRWRWSGDEPTVLESSCA
ncbi:GGDEF domain-containing protein [Bradyrhizobium cenepequi]|uniref:GGDEF domain-containing protein n=1 Tax=Bradyrhizobium cenepequi TaxID=2821403 RepID=UPI001CE34AAD|nr:GGDEF domain-containing protein [Bradyrhizobium cenepequi]